MAEFQASLFDLDSIDPVFEYTLSTDGTTITFRDLSNYDASDEDGNELSDFYQYRKIIVTHHTGTEYIMSSIGDGDSDIEPADINTEGPFDYVLTDKDGIYTINLITIPSWDAAAPYLGGVHIVYSQTTGKIYIAFNSSTGSNPATSSDWTEITTSQVTSKYSDTAYVKITFDSEKCSCSLTKKAACLIKDNCCNDDLLCKNKTFLNAIKVILLLRSAEKSFEDLDINCAGNDIDKIKEICACKCTDCPDC